MTDLRDTKKRKVVRSPEELFEIGIAEAQKARMYRKKTQMAIKWYLGLIRKLSPAAIDRSSFTKRSRLRQSIQFGKMYCYVYDAKTKDDLPYWDRFPLVFPVMLAENGWYGLNLHYIPVQLRSRLLYTLYQVINNKKYDESTKLKLSYAYINKLGTYDKALAKVAFKRYLTSHVRSRFIYIAPDEWPMALYLPMEKWQNMGAGRVYQDIETEIKRLRRK